MSAPDERPAGAGTQERLQRISRLFLSEEDEALRIALLTDADGPPGFPVDALARALARRGRSVAVIDAAAGLCSLTYPEPAMHSAAAPESDAGAERAINRMRGYRPPDFVIFAAPPPAAHIASCDLLLLAVPAHARGMRAAYFRLKALARCNRLPPVGITLTEAPGPAEAAAGFNKFSVAAQRFLGLRVTSYSYLAAAPPHGGSGSMLDDSARLLLSDWQDRQWRHVDGDHSIANKEPA